MHACRRGHIVGDASGVRSIFFSKASSIIELRLAGMEGLLFWVSSIALAGTYSCARAVLPCARGVAVGKSRSADLVVTDPM
eukprot:COSAG01_NODE_778_length_13681_cov_15.265130_20_plen_81_part_00